MAGRPAPAMPAIDCPTPRPLAAKLGLKDGMAVCALGAPADYPTLVGKPASALRLQTRPGADTQCVHLFVTARADLARQVARLRRTLPDDAMLWVSWPKQASRRPTDITEDVVRAEALPLGWVDVKVCAVDAVWSGLKLVVRKALRGSR